eukprot:CAMPEP_0198370354 /NCGR_PEP_ID=MMETSP1450-20131203/156672_1 /TAXON_ID=753684 ORGANISM="Madagascaria erythrocladiodes, Strain CCMP3234" /NCGR_SAMPLE_ID=MMETSP1450 /ASSEMBLY_ACC=CAM_ASM_001115 /LENGTH=409 /DNA_ID=CAMNT_0044077893 /DNA_START=101 /DNA_END=1330 /DNA_ORIENTATION=+
MWRAVVARGRVAARAGRTVRAFASGEPGPATILSDDEREIREAAARLAEREVAPRSAGMDRRGEMDGELVREMFRAGMMGVEVEARYGGTGGTFTMACLVVEEIARADPGVAAMVDVHNTLVTRALAVYGSDEQKDEVLTELATEAVGSFSISEDGSGSDAFALKTVAAKGVAEYTLNGSKAWVTNAAEAKWFIVFANAEKDKGYKGITAFLVPRDARGLTIGKKEDKLGIRASSCCPLHLDNVRVPERFRLGQHGEGYKIAIDLLNEGRIGIGAQMVGLAQGAMDYILPYLQTRKQFGTPIAEFQGMQFQVAQAHADLEAAKVLVYNAARLKDAGLPFVREAAIAKLYGSQVAERVASRCIEWAGGVGFTKDLPFEKFYRDVKIGAIYEGTSNIQLQTIAKLIMNPTK